METGLKNIAAHALPISDIVGIKNSIKSYILSLAEHFSLEKEYVPVHY